MRQLFTQSQHLSTVIARRRLQETAVCDTVVLRAAENFLFPLYKYAVYYYYDSKFGIACNRVYNCNRGGGSGLKFFKIILF